MYCVNNGAVMNAWAQDQGVDQTPKGLLTFMGDPSASVTAALGMTLDHAGPRGKGLLDRSKRFALYAENGLVKALEVSEGPGPEGEEDPAGDDFPEASCAPNMLKHIVVSIPCSRMRSRRCSRRHAHAHAYATQTHRTITASFTAPTRCVRHDAAYANSRSGGVRSRGKECFTRLTASIKGCG